MRSLFLLYPALIAHLFLCFPVFAGDKSINAQIAGATLVKEGQQAPDFSCVMLDGRSFELSAQKGKVVLLYFFASSAPFSITEMKYLESEVFQKLREREDFVMLGIGRGHQRDEVVKIGGENKLTFPLVQDTKEEIYRSYFSKFVPRTVVVRRDGTIAILSHGYKEYEGIVKLQAALEKELSAKGR